MGTHGDCDNDQCWVANAHEHGMGGPTPGGGGGFTWPLSAWGAGTMSGPSTVAGWSGDNNASHRHTVTVDLGNITSVNTGPGVIPGTTTDIESVLCTRCGCTGSPGDKLERQRRIDGGGLTGFYIGEALDIVVETLADFI